MSLIPDDQDKHDLYTYVGELPPERQESIGSITDKIEALINEEPMDGRIALGLVAMEVAGLSLIRIEPKGDNKINIILSILITSLIFLIIFWGNK